MCGIVALLSKKDSIKFLLNGLKQLQNRGYDSAGICIMHNEFNNLKFASTNEKSAIKSLENNLNLLKDGNIGIAHTRWATHGAKTDINSHPHISFDNKIALVHNGIIENFQELKDMLIENNINFKSQTDTEVIVNLIAFYYKENNNFLESLKKCVNTLQGTWGLAIMNLDEPNKLYAVRHGSPLLVSETEDFVILASEQSGFNGLVNNYIVLDSNDICVIEKSEDEITVITKNKYEQKKAIKGEYSLSPDPYPHWTLKEIEEQFDSSLRAISLGGRLLENNKVKLGGLYENIEVLKRIDNLIFLACGTSYFSALLGINYFKDLCNFNCLMLFDGAEFTQKDIPKLGNTCLVLLSQSGETKDLHRCIKIAKENDLFMLGVINVVDSMIAREVHGGCYLNAGREVAVASTKAFSSQVIILSLMAIWFSELHNTNSLKRRRYIDCVRRLPYDIKKSVEITKTKKDMILKILNQDNLFILGKGKSEAIAKEGALKIKEISYVHAEGYSGSSLKHGPFALLHEEFPVILVSPDDEHYIKMDNAFQEIKSRKAPILFITTNQDCDKENSIILPKNEIYGDLLCVIPLQLAAYFLSINKGINPDQPRNLAKVVTVE